MKKFYLIILVGLHLLCTSQESFGQCTVSQLNWDTKDYYWNSSGSAPYENYISNSLAQTQRFAIGRNWLSIVTSTSAMINPGANTSDVDATHTGDVTGFTGKDVQYNPTANGQTITITFNQPVTNTSFTLYDIDLSARFDLDAYNAASVAQPVNVQTYAGTILAITNNNAINTFVTATNTASANNSNTGTATFTIANTIKSIVITVTTRGTNPVFWLSDINACITNGDFPTDWHQAALYSRPFVGPTQSMPDYFLVTPDNNSVYYVNPANGQARELMKDVSKNYVNSISYDPYNQYMYFNSENITVDPSNKTLKRYDYKANTINHTFIPDIVSSLGVPTFNMGIESAAASMYDGSIYLGIEGGRRNSSGSITRKSIVWRIDLDGSGNPSVAYQVAAFDNYSGTTSTSIHDWGDFIIKNGVIYDFNTSRNSCGTGCYDYTNSKLEHYDLVTGQIIATYNNPNVSAPGNRSAWNSQSGMTWAGGLYSFRPKAGSSTTSEVVLYNEAGVFGTPVDISVVSGTAWPNASSGDASDPFRPKCDFGDAPASYDPYSNPAIQSPAVHERSENIRLGATWNDEFWKRGVTGSDDTDDGLPYAPVLPPGGGGYLVQASVYNNSGANATLIGWLDYNGNGLFDASEAATPITVPSSGSMQSFYVWWPYTPNTFSNGDYTYLRLRVTAASAGMTTSHATGYFTNGEVEDYRVLIDNFPLSINLFSFDAKAVENKKVQINWNASEKDIPVIYEIQRSRNATDWEHLDFVSGKGTQGDHSYNYTDLKPLKGVSYYRLRFDNGKYSNVRSVKITDFESAISVSPNPAQQMATLKIENAVATTINVNLFNSTGVVVLQKRFELNNGINRFVLPFENIPSGTYILFINNSEGDKVSKKIIINK